MKIKLQQSEENKKLNYKTIQGNKGKSYENKSKK